jgi:outer membrane protein TolC
MRKRNLIVCMLIGLGVNAYAQQGITLTSCYEMAIANYPLVKQKTLISKSTAYTVANARTGFLPQVSIYGQATYQSEVTRVPIDIPGFSVPTLSKDQYKIYTEINQTLFDGGAIGNQAEVLEKLALLETQKVEVELHKLKERINQLYFGVLLIDGQLVQVGLVKKDIQSSLQRVEASIQNGVALRVHADVLKAESIKATQREIELNALRLAYVQMLSMFINKPLDSNVVFEKPIAPVVSNQPEITRPELTLYRYQHLVYESQNKLNNTKRLPKVGLFLQGGYGRPALNFLNNDFNTYYLGGIRFSWNLSGFYSRNYDRQLREINQQSVNTQQETFLFNTTLSLTQQNQELTKLQTLLKTDDELIQLRTGIKETSKVQLEQGVITANDYLRELTAEDQARQNKLLHEIQLLTTLYTYQITLGN